MSTPTSSLVSRNPSPAPDTPCPPASTPTSSTASSTASSPASPTPSPEQHPVPGTFMFMPRGTQVSACSKSNVGNPDNHPVLLLPCTNPNFDPKTHVDVLFATTKDVVNNCNSKPWGCNFVPLADQVHPFRDPIPLSPGSPSFNRPSSVNVFAKYTVRRSYLQELDYKHPGSPAPTLPPSALDDIMQYVAYPERDVGSDWNEHAKQSQGKLRASPIITAPTTPIVAPLGSGSQLYVPPNKRKLSPEAQVFQPFAQPKVHRAYHDVSWRRIA